MAWLCKRHVDTGLVFRWWLCGYERVPDPVGRPEAGPHWRVCHWRRGYHGGARSHHPRQQWPPQRALDILTAAIKYKSRTTLSFLLHVYKIFMWPLSEHHYKRAPFLSLIKCHINWFLFIIFNILHTNCLLKTLKNVQVRRPCRPTPHPPTPFS